jgi:hypothetical protein
MFWAEAVATQVRSVVTATPVTRISLTPRLKRIWRRINKASPDLRADNPQAHPVVSSAAGRRKYDLSTPEQVGKHTRAGGNAGKFHLCAYRMLGMRKSLILFPPVTGRQTFKRL